MNGPEHYREAEKIAAVAHGLLERATGAVAEDFQRQAQSLAAIARVHATLALAAATALQTAGVPQDSDRSYEWRQITCRATTTAEVTP